VPRIEPFYLAPAVGFATWHLEHGESVPEVLERLRRHQDYCALSADEQRACVRRAVSDLKRWQRIRHCCGYTAEGGCCSWDEAEQEMKRVQSRPAADKARDAAGGCNRPGDG